MWHDKKGEESKNASFSRDVFYGLFFHENMHDRINLESSRRFQFTKHRKKSPTFFRIRPSGHLGFFYSHTNTQNISHAYFFQQHS